MSDWSNSARRLKSHFANVPFHSKAIEWLDSLSSQPIGVACSGGADSLALLLLLWARHRELRPRLKVLHLNHGVRGEAADADVRFVAEVAESLDLEFVSRKAEFASRGRLSEEALRDARLAFFCGSGCAAIMLGHHANDVAESVLMRLCRGAGASGLAAPRPVSQPVDSGPVHLRPLLDWSREQLIEGLEDSGIRWREDASNAAPDYFRNRVRHNIWPGLLLASPGDALAGITRSRALIEEDSRALDTWLESIFPEELVSRRLETSAVTSAPRAIWRRALTRWAAGNGVIDSLSATAFEQLLTDWRAGRAFRISAGNDHFIVGDDRGLRLTDAEDSPEWLPIRLTIGGGGVALPNHRWLHAELIELDDARRLEVLQGAFCESETVHLQWDGESGQALSVRRWEPGDRYQPLGAPGSRKVQDCFTDRKIAESERKRLPVVLDSEGRIIWIPGLAPSEERRLGPDAKSALWLTYRPF